MVKYDELVQELEERGYYVNEVLVDMVRTFGLHLSEILYVKAALKEKTVLSQAGPFRMALLIIMVF